MVDARAPRLPWRTVENEIARTGFPQVAGVRNQDDGEQNVPFARTGRGNYDIVIAFFCGLLLISNVAATKLITIGPFNFDGGAMLFPLTYVLGDVLAEVYGMRRARRAIITGFVLAGLMSACFLFVGALPPMPSWGNNDAWTSVLGFVPRIVIASLCGYLCGQFLNAFVVVKIKQRTKEKALWVRLVSSTVVGEFVDTAVFCTVAFGGTMALGAFVNYTLLGFVYKVVVEIVMLPVTYRVIAAVKRREPSYGPAPVTAVGDPAIG